MPEKPLERKRQVKVTFDRTIWAEARALGIIMSKAGERGLREAVERERARKLNDVPVAS